MSVGWGHDFTVALLVNVGGNDVYDVKGDGLSYSINRSVTALIDIGGDDRYIGKAGNRPGMTLFSDRFRARGGLSDYFADTTSVGLFLDIGGEDVYATHPPDKEDHNEKDSAKKESNAEPPAPFGGANNDTWLDEPDSDNSKERNFGIGVDRPSGDVHFRPGPEKTPSGR
ncbi:MAG: hypothetical protein IID33_12800 [Planctomycetes bacterium]|nr:hypothetical protein [Planctomycetota bacterium]